jgi:RHS repeat-associated protein
VTTGQNGPNSAAVVTTYFDQYGRAIWVKDADGYLQYAEYDQATGTVSKTIVDVNTSLTSDFTNLPSGWSTPSGGGLHLKTTKEIDPLGRSTKITDPNTNITYVVYRDSQHEIRTYIGWNTSTHRPTGPTIVQRFDRTGSYLETLTMSATPSLDGSNRPTGTESVSGLQTLSRQYVSAGGQVTRQDDYFNLSGLTYSTSQFIGTLDTHYYKTLIDYNKRGRVNRTVTPTGTINRTEYDLLGRVVSVWVGTNDTPGSGFWSPTNNTSPANMVKTAEYEYDDGGIGDGNLTEVTQIPGGSAANRVSQFYFDWRNRLVAWKDGAEVSESTSLNRPVFYQEYDNLNQVVAQEQYDGDGVSITDANSDGVPDKPSSSLLRARSANSFDEQGRTYRTQVYSVNQSSGSISSDALTTNTWFNHRDMVVKSSMSEGLVTKNEYDGARRLTKVFTTDGGGDSSWSDAFTVINDNVLQQVEYGYDAKHNVQLITTRERFHDETGTGTLGTPGSGVKARVSYVANFYDKANRLTDRVDVGTNAGSSYSWPGSVPSRSDTVLITSTTYNDAGWVSIETDPRGIESRTTYDALGRTVKTIEAYGDGTPSNTDDKTTEFTYDGSGHTLTQKTSLTGGDYQEYKWVYGVTTAASSSINSNDVLAEMWHPHKSTGVASSSEKDIYTINALDQPLTRQDRNGNIHTFSYDVVGRGTADAVTTLGGSVNGAVRRLETAYDTAGRAYLFTSYDASSSGNIVNQVQREFNGLGQLTVEYQSHSGAVNTMSTPKVQYAYSEMSGGANHSRLTSVTYPNGRVITYNYASGLASDLSRLSSLTDGGTTLEGYDYLGLGTVVRRTHAQTGVDLTYIKQGAEADGDAGDKYTGLDRFGRVVDQRWLKTSDSSHTDRFQYGFDRSGNVLYEKNLVDTTFSELYHANGASNGYDSLNQISEFRRGSLSDANSDGVPDTVTTASRSQVWTYDPLGNWSTVSNDGTAQNRTHNRQNQITSITSLTTPAYDANGNLTGDENGKTLVYDAWNRMVDYKNGSTSLESYTYDALNRRVTENPGTARSLFYTADWQVVEERVSGVAVVSLVWSPVFVDALIARDRDADANAGNGLEERLYAQHDANWNTTAILNSGGTVQERYIYDPFGSPSFKDASYGNRSTSSFAWTHLHQGGRRSSPTGLMHFRNRDLSPSLGRWLVNDPIGMNAGDQNLIRYVGNNPVDATDPEGLLQAPGGNQPQPPGKKDPRCPDDDWFLTSDVPFLGAFGVRQGDWIVIVWPEWKPVLEDTCKCKKGGRCFASKEVTYTKNGQRVWTMVLGVSTGRGVVINRSWTNTISDLLSGNITEKTTVQIENVANEEHDQYEAVVQWCARVEVSFKGRKILDVNFCLDKFDRLRCIRPCKQGNAAPGRPVAGNCRTGDPVAIA